jgi:DNA-binding NarL/FixJ family response regulator
MNGIYNILIIDDNASFARSLCNLISGTLDKQVDTIYVAAEIDDGLVLLKHHKFDYVFLSIKIRENLDWISGAVHNIKTLQPSGKIVTISLHNELRLLRQKLKNSVARCLSKDEIEAETLIELFDINTNQILIPIT